MPTPREAFRARPAKGFTAMETASELSRDLSGKAEAFCRSYLPNGRLAGNYWKVGDTSGIEGESLQVRLAEVYGKKAGRWTEYVASGVMLRCRDRARSGGRLAASTQHNVSARGAVE